MKRSLKTISAIAVFLIATALLRYGALAVDAAVTVPSLARLMQDQEVEVATRAEFPQTLQPFTDATKWYVRDSITSIDLVREQQVTLVHVWGDACVSCMELAPNISAWNKKYRDRGFEVVAVYEGTAAEEAIKAYSADYRVAADGSGKIANAYEVHAWPASFVYDQQGNLALMRFGNESEDIESKIRELLKWTDADDNPVKEIPPWIHPGWNQRSRFDSPEPVQINAEGIYSYPETIATKHFALSGRWILNEGYVEAMEAGAAIKFRFDGSGLKGSLEMPDGSQRFPTVKVDGRYLTWPEAGTDVQVNDANDGRSFVMLTLFLHADIANLAPGDHIVEIIADAPGERVSYLEPK